MLQSASYTGFLVAFCNRLLFRSHVCAAVRSFAPASRDFIAKSVSHEDTVYDRIK